MSFNSTIEWCHATFNIVWGCSKKSPGCAGCYALGESRRRGFNVWGLEQQGATRRVFGEDHWAEPLTWNRRAQRLGVRYRVFCGSMTDITDEHSLTRAALGRLFPLIEATPFLDWLLLTKEPWHWETLLPATWRIQIPRNAWFGTSAENQPWADRRVPAMFAAVPHAARYFVSAEPLLGPTNFLPFMLPGSYGQTGLLPSARAAARSARANARRRGEPLLDWIIDGGESGPKARPSHVKWFRANRDAAYYAGVPYLHKQNGAWACARIEDDPTFAGGRAFNDPRGGRSALEKRAGLTMRGVHDFGDNTVAVKLRSKKAGGRSLDGIDYNATPTAADAL